MLVILVLIGPVVAGLAGTTLPAFGYFPTLGFTTVSLDPVFALFSQPGIWISSWQSLFVGLATSVISLFVVLIVLAAWSETRALRTIQFLVGPLLSVPHAAAAFGLAFLIAPSGWIIRLVSPWPTGFERPPDWIILNDPHGLSLIAGLVAKEIPFLLLVSLAASRQIDTSQRLTIAQSLGYGRMAAWFKVILPALYGRIRLPIFAVIAYGASVVDVALILGPTRPSLLSVRILQWQSDADLDKYLVAAAGALWQAILVVFAIGLWVAAERLVAWALSGALSDGRRALHDRHARYAAFGLTLFSSVAVIAGVFILALWSIARTWRFPDSLPSKLSPDTWARTLDSIALPMSNTFVIAGVSVVIGLVLTILCLEQETRSRKALSPRFWFVIYVPLILPQLSFLFGTASLFSRFDLTGTLIGTIMVHTVFVLPYIFLTLVGPWQRQDPRYTIVSNSLGVSQARHFFLVRLRMMLPAVLTAGAVGFAVSVGQYLPTTMIGSGRIETVTTEAVALASGGNRRLVGAYALVQTVVAFVGFFAATIVTFVLFRNRRGMGGFR